MPKTKWDGYGRFCPLAKGLDVVGERWTLVIVHALLGGPSRYNELKTGLPGIGTNVLSDRLRKLEAAGVVCRTPGEVGKGVFYELTERGYALGPMMAELRRWGVDVQFVDDRAHDYDFSYAIPDELGLDESYEWRIDGNPIALTIDGQMLRQRAGHAVNPVVVVETSIDFMRLWASGDSNWDRGRAAGAVSVVGHDDAWNRMLVATGYPGKPAGLVEQLLQDHRKSESANSAS